MIRYYNWAITIRRFVYLFVEEIIKNIHNTVWENQRLSYDGGNVVLITFDPIRTRRRGISEAGCLFQKRNNDAGASPAIVNSAKREKWREFHFFFRSILFFPFPCLFLPPDLPSSSLSRYLMFGWQQRASEVKNYDASTDLWPTG